MFILVIYSTLYIKITSVTESVLESSFPRVWYLEFLGCSLSHIQNMKFHLKQLIFSAFAFLARHWENTGSHTALQHPPISSKTMGLGISLMKKENFTYWIFFLRKGEVWTFFGCSSPSRIVLFKLNSSGKCRCLI